MTYHFGDIIFFFTNTRPLTIFWVVHAFTQPSTARSIFVDNLRGVDLEGGNALASSGGFVMPNFFFQAILVTAGTVPGTIRL